MKYTKFQTLSTLAFLFILTAMCANTLWARGYVSATPRYMTIILPEFGGKGISVVFDESAGTGKGFNTVYADANVDGTISDNEKFTSESKEATDNSPHTFPVIALKPASEIPVSYEIAFTDVQLDQTENFSISIIRKMPYKGTTWRIEYGSGITPSTNPDKPYIYTPIAAPKISLKTGPNGRATGVALALASNGVAITSPDITVDLQMKNTAGKIIRQDKGILEKYAFG